MISKLFPILKNRELGVICVPIRVSRPESGGLYSLIMRLRGVQCRQIRLYLPYVAINRFFSYKLLGIPGTPVVGFLVNDYLC